jgi:purine-nucleoside phosphorylase
MQAQTKPEDQNQIPTLYERAEHAARVIRARLTEAFDVRIGIVLGSGLGAFASELADKSIIPYSEIPGFARSTVEGHAGQLVVGKIENAGVAAMQGRFHFYEGYSLEETTFPIRTLHALGCRSLVLTNAAGGINVAFDQGSLMLINDHINLMGTNPLRGANDERFGARFPDMSEVYDREYQEIAVNEARAIGLELRRGVYAAMTGPSYETPAEVRMLRTLGADAVGMSTVPEAIIARHAGMRVLGISCITNMAAGVLDQPINHDEVMETGARVREAFAELLRRTIPKLQ